VTIGVPRVHVLGVSCVAAGAVAQQVVSNSQTAVRVILVKDGSE
jgi:hypothetical protein